MTSVSGTDLVCDGLDESAMVAVRLVVPLPVGVPEINPVVADRLSPLGRPPEVIDQAKGAVPPLDCSEAEYAVPIAPGGRDDEVIVKAVGVAGAATTGRETVVVADCTDEPESVTLMPNE
jgi:hypothetical protein